MKPSPPSPRSLGVPLPAFAPAELRRARRHVPRSLPGGGGSLGDGGRDLRVLGIDPGTHVLGWGVVAVRETSVRLIDFGVVRGGSGELPDRLRRIHDGLEAVLRRARPDVIAVERVFVAKDPRATITLGEGRGVALLAAARAVASERRRVGGLERGRHVQTLRRSDAPTSRIVEITPAEVKKAVAGNGAATKAQVQRMVQMQLGMSRPPHPADAADALAVAICAALRTSISHAVGRSGSRDRSPGLQDFRTSRLQDFVPAGSLPPDVLRRAFSKRR